MEAASPQLYTDGEFDFIFKTAKTSHARHIIQVNLIAGTREGIPPTGVFTLWQKGAFGGSDFGTGDVMIHWCPRTGCFGRISGLFDLTEEEVARIPVSDVDNFAVWPQDIQERYLRWEKSPLVCPVCGFVVKSQEQLAESWISKAPMDRLAKVLEHIFMSFGMDADIFLVRGNIGKFNMMQAREAFHDPTKTPAQRAAALAEAKKHERAYYPLDRIMKDVGGSNFHKAFLTLLKA